MKLIEAGTRQFYILEYYKRNVSDLVIVTQADKQRYYDDNKQAFYEFPNITLNYIQTKDEADALASPLAPGRLSGMHTADTIATSARLGGTSV